MDQSSFMNQWEFSSLYQQQALATAAHSEYEFQLPQFSNDQNFSNNSSVNLLNSSLLDKPMLPGRPRKYPKTISWSSEEILVAKEVERENVYNFNERLINWRCQLNNHDKGLMKKTPDEHIIAERKRREKLSQRFIALAAIIPGLKKVDKASILSDTITYVKQLEQTLKSLEDQNARKTVESAILLKKYKQSINSTDDTITDNNFNGNSSETSSNSNENSDLGSPLENSTSPEIQVRLSEKTVLVRIHCENIKGVLVKVLSEIEQLQLVVTNASATPFTESFLDITVTAQMEEGFSMSVKDLAKKISSILLHFN